MVELEHSIYMYLLHSFSQSSIQYFICHILVCELIHFIVHPFYFVLSLLKYIYAFAVILNGLSGDGISTEGPTGLMAQLAFKC